MRKRNVTRFAKKCLAYSLATVTIATSALGGLTFMQEPVVVEAATADMLSNQERGVIFANSRTDFRDESIYFLITTRFYDGDSSNNTRTSEDKKAQNPEYDPSWRGDFKGLIDKLDYIKALGFTAIWITPVVENDSGYDYHGYHAYDFSAVDTRYESNGVTYQTLIDAVHEKGMKVIQDVVLNHTCNWGEKNLIQLTSDIYGERNQAVMNGSNDPDNIYHHNGFCGGGDWDEYAAQNKTIADDCFDLETENPKVYNYLVDCYQKYINMGVDAFRIDTAKHISRLTFNTVFLPAFKEAGGEDFFMFGEVCTKGHDVWYRGNPPVSTCFYTWDDTEAWKSRWSDSLASNEKLVEQHYVEHKDTSNQPTSDNAFLKGNDYHAPDYSMQSGMSVIDFQMHWGFNNANQAYSIALGQDRYFNDATWNVVYVDSHDYSPDQSQTQRYPGGTEAWAENLSLMFTFRGIPCIYYGSEIEFQAGKTIDKGPGMKLEDTGRAYFGDHIEGEVDTLDFTVFGNVSGVVQETLNSKLSQHIMRLNRIRQAIPALRKGQYSTEGCSGNMAFKRRYTDSTTDSFVLVAISGDATFSGIPNGKYVDAVTGDIQNVSGGTLTAKVSGKGNMKVYVLDTAKTPAPGRVIPNGDFLKDGGSAVLIGPEPIDITEATNVTVDKSSVSVMQAKTATVKATVEPSNATYKTVTWSTSDASVATVNGGVITGVGIGTATITAKTHNGLTATVKVTVTKNPDLVDVTGVTLSPTTTEVEVKSTVNLTATVTPSNATNKKVTWSSSDDKVATVSDGVVTGVAPGTAVITVTTSNGKTATATVTVTGKAVPIIENGVYFEKPSGWGSTIYAYAWSGNTEHFGAWKGKAMEDLGNGLYGISCDFDEANTKIIFNDGVNQTADLAFKKNGYYTSSGFSHVVEPVVTGTVVVKYEDEDGNVLSTKTMTGKVGDSYTTTASTFDGYTLKTKPSNATGKYTSSTITVTYVYSKNEEKPVDDLEVSLKSNTTSVNVGSSITLTATATGGDGDYNYTFLVKNTSTGSWATLAENVSTNKHTWKAESAGTREFYVEVTDGDGNTVRSEKVTVTANKVTSDLSATAKVSATSVSVGNTVTITGTATGGAGSYKYSYIVYNKDTKKWARIKDKSTSNTYTWKAESGGTRVFYVDVTDASGKTVRATAGTVKTTDSTLKVTAKVSDTNIIVGDSITITGTASGGTGSYKYSYIVYNKTTGKWARIKDKSTSNTYTWKATSAGTREFYVDVTDASGKTVRSAVMTVVTKKSATSLSVVGSATSSSVSVGKSINIVGTAMGGSGSYTYSFVVYNQASDSWYRYGFTSSNILSWKATSKGTRKFYVEAKDSSGNVKRSEEIVITVK